MHRSIPRAAVLLLAGTTAWSCAKTPATPTPQATPARAATPVVERGTVTEFPATGGGRGNAGGGDAAAPRPYNRVITSGMQSRDGLVRTHRDGARVLFEVPASVLGKDILLVQQIEATTLGAGYGGQAQGNRVVRWERMGNRMLLRLIPFDITADASLPIARAVAASNVPPILASFNIEAFGADSSSVVDVTRLFTQPPWEMSPAARYRGQVDAARTWIESAHTYPTNVEVRSTITITNTPAAGGGGGRGGAAAAFTMPPTATFLMHWSFLKLPETPMMARYFDQRVGYFSVGTTDFGADEPRVVEKRFISRWRLECSDRMVGNLCVPKKPIEYYVDPATPEWLVPWVKKGIESWQSAFAEAGFYQGIVAKDAPTKAQDPEWSAEDARYSVVRWLPSNTQNASGPSIKDPRSGEIIESDIQMYHNVMNLGNGWYFAQASAADPRARVWPFPNDLSGRMLMYVVAHEVGHTIGMQHNMKSSGTYPVDSLRSKTWAATMGHTPSIMDYSRFNYVAQPEDGIDPEHLVPGIGPYDKFMIAWGYKPIPGARTPEDERKTLDEWARVQDTVPWLRFSTAGNQGADYQDNTEAVGDNDPVKAAEYGQRNFKRMMGYLQPAANRPYDDSSDLQELYGRVVGQWGTVMRHVTTVVGASETQEKYNSQPGARFTPVSKARQKDAVRFLNENVFKTPMWMIDMDILRRLEPAGTIGRVSGSQTSILNALMNEARMARLVDYEATATRAADAYPLMEFLADVRGGVFGELTAGSVVVDPYRRALQRSYVNAMRARLAPPAAAAAPAGGGGRGGAAGSTNTDVRGALRAELRTLDAQLRTALAKTSDRATRAHLEDCRTEIASILKGGTADGGAAGGGEDVHNEGFFWEHR
jgi:hypothetical protein